MQILKTSALAWRRGKKTKGLKAKALINLLVDRFIVNKFLIDTLEGKEPIDSANIFCIGEAGDAWQQTSKALLKKYDVKAIDDGTGHGYITGKWGATIDGVENLQAFVLGDFLCHQPDDHTDQWIVRRTLFLNTYTELGGK